MHAKRINADDSSGFFFKRDLKAAFLNNKKIKDALTYVTFVNVEAFPGFQRPGPVRRIEQAAIFDVIYRTEWYWEWHEYTLAFMDCKSLARKIPNTRLIFSNEIARTLERQWSAARNLRAKLPAPERPPPSFASQTARHMQILTQLR